MDVNEAGRNHFPGAINGFALNIDWSLRYLFDLFPFDKQISYDTLLARAIDNKTVFQQSTWLGTGRFHRRRSQ